MSDIAVILTSTVIATIISSSVALINIYSTKRSFKISNYVNVITSERIKWLDIIRNEVTKILAQINLVINDIEEEYEGILAECNANSETDLCRDILNIPKNNILSSDKSIWKEQDFIEHLYLLKLRLNPKEDKEIIEIINYYISFFSKSEYSDSDIKEARKYNIRWIELIQQLLKDEWEKVKKETKGNIGKKLSKV